MKRQKISALLLAIAVTASTFSYATAADTAEETSADLSSTIFEATRTDFRDESIYHLRISRFYDGDESNNVCCWDDAAYGNDESDPGWRGDFKGLIEKLDYIKALGFTAVSLNPVAQSTSAIDYSGTYPFDMKKTEKRLESDGYTYQDLIDACHEKGLKVMQSVVLGSTSVFGEEHLAKLYDIKDDGDWRYNKGILSPTERLLKSANCDTADEYWQYPLNVFTMSKHLIQNTNYNVFCSTGLTPVTDDDNIVKISDSDTYNPDNNYHTGYFSKADLSIWNKQFANLAFDFLDVNTENPDVGVYLAEVCKMYADYGADAILINNVDSITRVSLNLGIIKPLKEMLAADGKNIEIFAECYDVPNGNTWNTKGASMSTPFYTWAEQDEYLLENWIDAGEQKAIREDINSNMNLAFRQIRTNYSSDNQPTSDNAMLRGIEYHKPDYSKASGINMMDSVMRYYFYGNNYAFDIAKENDSYYNDATFNITHIDTYEHSQRDSVYKPNFSEEEWEERLAFLFTFRGIPQVLCGTEVMFQKGALLSGDASNVRSETADAYYGNYLEGTLTQKANGEYEASGRIADSLSSPVAQKIQQLNAIRKAVPALRKGQYTVSDDYVNGNYAFIRRYTNPNEGIDSLALVSMSDASFKNIPNGRYVDAVTGDVQIVNDNSLKCFAPKNGIRVYVCEAEGFTKLDENLVRQQYTLSFDANGGGGTMNSLTSGANGYVTLPNTTFKAPLNSSFGGWMIDGVSYKAGDKVFMSKNQTATASWKQVDGYPLFFDDIQVTSENCNNITGDRTAKYDHAEKKLTLKGYNGGKISTEIAQLNIFSEGGTTNTVGGITSSGTITIQGGGSTVINGGIACGTLEMESGTVKIVGEENAINAANECNISGGIVTLMSKTGSAIQAGTAINISGNANVTAASQSSSALSKAADTSAYSAKHKEVASTEMSDHNSVSYTAANNGSYKYYRINPYSTLSFDSDGGTGAMDRIDTTSGIVTLPECTFTSTDGSDFVAWKIDGKNYKAGASVVISGDQTATAAWGVGVAGGDTVASDEIVIYLDTGSAWDEANAYFYGGATSGPIWPGISMTKIDGTNIWKTTVKKDVAATVIFNDRGSHQSDVLTVPSDGNTLYLWDSGTWNGYSGGAMIENTEGKYKVSYQSPLAMGYISSALTTNGKITLPVCTLLPPKYGMEFVGWYVNNEICAPGNTVTITNSTTVKPIWNTVSIEAADFTSATIYFPTAGTYSVVFADYEDGRLAGAEIATVTATVGLKKVDIAGDIKLSVGDKVMVLNDLNGLMPLCDAFTATE